MRVAVDVEQNVPKGEEQANDDGAEFQKNREFRGNISHRDGDKIRHEDDKDGAEEIDKMIRPISDPCVSRERISRVDERIAEDEDDDLQDDVEDVILHEGTKGEILEVDRDLVPSCVSDDEACGEDDANRHADVAKNDFRRDVRRVEGHPCEARKGFVCEVVRVERDWFWQADGDSVCLQRNFKLVGNRHGHEFSTERDIGGKCGERQSVRISEFEDGSVEGFQSVVCDLKSGFRVDDSS